MLVIRLIMVIYDLIIMIDLCKYKIIFLKKIENHLVSKYLF